ncbi:family 16 glycosylhydrolase [Sulfitobacter sp.]|jgi:beta-glucanase (GH16 family)|uniref:family 16 glycosylhydrolase n=1 Tax=Sulfitobacter sp. TaxID=1903071 RepID=UPI003EF508E3
MARKTKQISGNTDDRSKGKIKENTEVDAETNGAPSNTVTIEGQSYVLTFNDEFNGSTASYWTGHGKAGIWATSYSPHLQDSRTNAANNELQYYVDPDMSDLPDPFKVEGGLITINASQLDDAQKDLTGGLGYSSGMLSTEMSLSIDGGYIEMSADIPDQTGMWSAFWLMPSDGDWSAEIDVVEYLGDTGDTLFTNLWDQGTPDPLQIENSGAGDGFHTYGLYWDDTVIRWTLDGVTIRESANTVQEDMYLIFNLAVGGWADEPDSTTDLSDGFSIDYVRVYELESDPYRNAAIDDGEFLGADVYGGTLYGDILNGSRWADLLDGSSGQDTLYGDGGDDHLNGGSGDDYVFGQAGDDALSGGAGSDEIVGGQGSDIITGGADTDHLWGGSYGFDGSGDTFVFTNGTGADYIHDYEAGLDQIDLSDFSSDWALIWQNTSDLGWATHIDLAALGGSVDDQVYMVGSNLADLSSIDFGFDLIV